MRRPALGLLTLPGLLSMALLAACLARPRPEPPGPPQGGPGPASEPSSGAAVAAPRAWPPAELPALAAAVAASPANDAWPPVARALDASCRPCHFPGGKMYERMPFDDLATVRAHGHGIGKRLEGEELAALEALLASPH